MCVLTLSSCVTYRYGSTKDINARRGLMLSEPNEISRNKPYKFSKAKKKQQLYKKNKRVVKRYQRKHS